MAALAFCFVSCEKDKPNDDDTTINARLIGTWTLVKTETNDYENGDLKFTNSEIETSTNSIEFKNDGTVTTTQDVEFQTASYTITNSGKTINFISDGEKYSYEIRAIIPTDLVLYRENISTSNGITRKFTALLSYKRK